MTLRQIEETLGFFYLGFSCILRFQISIKSQKSLTMKLSKLSKVPSMQQMNQKSVFKTSLSKCMLNKKNIFKRESNSKIRLITCCNRMSLIHSKYKRTTKHIVKDLKRLKILQAKNCSMNKLLNKQPKFKLVQAVKKIYLINMKRFRANR